MTVYGIKDTHTNRWWSHNKWGTETSIPDLYSSIERAQYQIKKGKIALDVNRNLVYPVVVELTLTESLHDEVYV